MRNVAIIHFQPLELYPPIQNFLRFLCERPSGIKVYVFTTASPVKTVPLFEVNSAYIKIKRLGKSSKGFAPLIRYWNYLLFYFGCLWHLIQQKPMRILYYETLSFLPAYLYKTFCSSGVGLMAHYHEYTSLLEYETGMLLGLYLKKAENRCYPKAEWLSHTNNYRLKMFLSDNPDVPQQITHVLPNYPPKAWAKPAPSSINKPVRFVYAGALGLKNMYLTAMVNWVNDQNGQALLDLYSLNISPGAKLFLQANAGPYVKLLPGISYDQLGGVLSEYNVGVILYNGHIPNYIYNAPNKLFEYLACGLDVWLPKEMTGSLEYVTTDTYPKVVALDFKKLKDIDIDSMINRDQLHLRKNTCYLAENVYPELMEALYKVN